MPVLIAYQGRFQPYSQDGRHFVKVYTLDNDVNRNDWGVTPEARARSMGTFFQHPLLGPKHLSPEHVIDPDPTHPHYGEHAVIGRPVDFESNGATYGIYEVTVDQAWDMIQAGQLSAVSPSVHINNAHYSDDGKQIITDFAWDHVLFVEVPAIGGARVVGTCTASDPRLCSFGQAVQAAFKGQHFDAQTDFDLERVLDMRGNPAQAAAVQERLGKKAEGNDLLEGGGIFQEILRSQQFGHARNAQGERCTLESLFPQQQIAQASKTLRALGAL